MITKKAIFFSAFCGCLILSASLLRAEEESVNTLISRLRAGNESARLQVIDQLGADRAKASEAVEPLTDLLKDRSAKIRAHAAAALGEIGPAAKPAVAALAELLKDTDSTVRRQAVKAVMKIHPGPQVMVPLCVKLLEDPDPGVRVRVLNAIADAGPRAVPGLIKALKNDKVAYWACLVLREMGPAAKDAVPALTEKLNDPRPEIRREAILALAAMGDVAKPAVGAIAANLARDDSAVAATYALGRIGQIPPEADGVIRANAKSADKLLSTTSLWTLVRVYPKDKELRRETTERLIEGLKDQDPFVRTQAAHALAALPPAPEITGPIWEKALQDADETTVRNALDAVASLGPAAVPRLIHALKHEKLRGQIVYILGQIGPPAAPAAPALARLLADKNDRVVHETTLALAKIGPGAKIAVPSLIDALEHGENSNAATIVYALGKIGPASAPAEPVLSRLLRSPDSPLALASAWALVQIQPASPQLAEKTLYVLIAGLDNPLPVARQGAAEAIGQLGPSAKTAVSFLEKASRDENESVRDAAARAIRSVRGGAAK
jgi:HEAT repeat protein